MSDNLDDLFLDVKLDHRGDIDDDHAHNAVMRLLDDARLAADRTTPTELWRVLQSLPNAKVFGPVITLLRALTSAEQHGLIRRTATGHILLRLDAPSDGGPEHVWVRFPCGGGAEVEVTGATSWPDGALDAPGPAWWRCTGCRERNGHQAEDFTVIRDQAHSHARQCHTLPAPPPAERTPSSAIDADQILRNWSSESDATDGSASDETA